MKKIWQGWRYFDCEDCGAKFRETCRDHSTASISRCVTEDCPSHAHGGLSPVSSRSDWSVQVDDHGNLIGDRVVERLDGKN